MGVDEEFTIETIHEIYKAIFKLDHNKKHYNGLLKSCIDCINEKILIRPQINLKNADKVAKSKLVAMGDIHGDLPNLIEILMASRTLDAEQRFLGEQDRVIVQVGDLIDRGVYSLETYLYIRIMQERARKEGREFILCVGNHELHLIKGVNIDHPSDETKENLERSKLLRRMLFEDIKNDRLKLAAFHKNYLFVHAGFEKLVIELFVFEKLKALQELRELKIVGELWNDSDSVLLQRLEKEIEIRKEIIDQDSIAISTIFEKSQKNRALKVINGEKIEVKTLTAWMKEKDISFHNLVTWANNQLKLYCERRGEHAEYQGVAYSVAELVVELITLQRKSYFQIKNEKRITSEFIVIGGHTITDSRKIERKGKYVFLDTNIHTAPCWGRLSFLYEKKGRLSSFYKKKSGKQWKENKLFKEGWKDDAGKMSPDSHDEQQTIEPIAFSEGINQKIKKAFTQENVKFQYALGVCYAKGKEVEKNSEAAFWWYRQAAKNGRAKAQYMLGLHCAKKGDIEGAVKWYCRATRNDGEVFSRWVEKNGNALVQYIMGVCYFDGDGVQENSEKAVVLFTKAAKKNHARAQYLLAVCYANDNGVKTPIRQLSPKEAAESIARLATEDEIFLINEKEGVKILFRTEAGNNQMEKLVVSKEEFRDISQLKFDGSVIDKAKMPGVYKTVYMRTALNLFLESAKNGDVQAQFALGQLYADGIRVKEDIAMAMKWYAQAMENCRKQSGRSFVDEGKEGEEDKKTEIEVVRFAGKDRALAAYALCEDYEDDALFKRIGDMKDNLNREMKQFGINVKDKPFGIFTDFAEDKAVNKRIFFWFGKSKAKGTVESGTESTVQRISVFVTAKRKTP